MAHKDLPVTITLQEGTAGLIARIARKEKKAPSFIVEELIAEALDRREDYALSKLAEARDLPDEQRVSHEDAWKE